jgi:predicted ribosomally synthesized peptide with nif11-like leader
MSKADVQRLHQEVLQDVALQQRLRDAKDDQSLVALALEIGQQKGYTFTKEEAQQYIKDLNISRSQQELSDEQLEAIAGGRTTSAAYLDNCTCATSLL